MYVSREKTGGKARAGAARKRTALAMVVFACAAACMLTGCLQSHPVSSASESAASSSPSAESASSAVTDTSASSAASSQSISAAPTGDPALAALLESDMRAIVEASGVPVGAAVVDLPTATRADYQGNLSLPAASMIKLLIAHTFLEGSKTDPAMPGLDDVYTLQSSDIVGGTGTLGGLGAGAQVTYRELVSRMIDVSDNTAANVLIDAVGGMEAVNADARKLGLVGTELNRYMMDTDALARGIDNYTSASDCAKLLEMIYKGSFVDLASSQLMLQALEQQQDEGGISAGLGSNVLFAHKTGSLSNARHDGGIVEGEHPYVIVVLCGGDGFYLDGANAAMRNIASAVDESLANAGAAGPAGAAGSDEAAAAEGAA